MMQFLNLQGRDGTILICFSLINDKIKEVFSKNIRYSVNPVKGII